MKRFNQDKERTIMHLMPWGTYPDTALHRQPLPLPERRGFGLRRVVSRLRRESVIHPVARSAMTLVWILILWWVFLLAVPAAGAQSSPESPAPWRTILAEYETLREHLFEGELDALETPARALARRVEALEDEPSADATGVAPQHLAVVRELLSEVRRFALEVAAAEDLKTARLAFGELTQPVVRWRKHLRGEDLPQVMYCAMSRKAWLQPADQPMENPYHGRSMARCGEVVLED